MTGFTSRDQLKQVSSWLMGAPLPGSLVMIGVLVSQKSLAGVPLKPEWADRYPAVDEIEAIWSVDQPEPGLLKTIPSTHATRGFTISCARL